MTTSRTVSHVVVPGLAALISAANVPSAVSAASCRLNDPHVLRDIYLSALQAANRFGFLLGNLVLHYGKGDARETMLFERDGSR